MSTEQIVWIIVIAVVVLALIGLVAWLMNNKKKQRQHEEAQTMRREAAAGASAIPEEQVRAQEAEARAEQTRLQAERAEAEAARAHQGLSQEQARHEDQVRKADRLDPAVDHRSADYHPDTASTETTRPTYDETGRVTPEEKPPTTRVDEHGRPLDDHGRPLDESGGSHRA